MALQERFIAVLRYANGAPLVENHERPQETYLAAMGDAERKLTGAHNEGVSGIHATIEKRLYLA